MHSTTSQSTQNSVSPAPFAGTQGPTIPLTSPGPPAPIIYSTLSAEGIQRLIAPKYHLDEPVECLLFNRGVSDTYLISSRAGRAALKLYRANWRTRDEILGELNAVEHLSAKGIQVAKPIRRRDGGLITDVLAPEGVRSAVLYHWASGRQPKYTEPSHSHRYGRLLAELHMAAEDLTTEGIRPRMDIDYLLTVPMDHIRNRVRHLPCVARPLEELVARLANQLRPERLQRLDWGFCHGDVWAGNARIDGERLVLFDFDFCGPGWRVSDLASFRWEARQQNAESLAWRPFVEGYREVRPQIAPSLEVVGPFMVLRHLWTTAHWIGMTQHAGAAFLPDEYFEDLVPFCEKIESEVL